MCSKSTPFCRRKRSERDGANLWKLELPETQLWSSFDRTCSPCYLQLILAPGNDMQLIARQNSPASPLSPKSAKTPQSPKPPMAFRGQEWGREKWDQLRIGSGQGYRWYRNMGDPTGNFMKRKGSMKIFLDTHFQKPNCAPRLDQQKHTYKFRFKYCAPIVRTCLSFLLCTACCRSLAFLLQKCCEIPYHTWYYKL